MTTLEAAPLLAFHDSAAIKRKYVRRVEAHRKADELVQRVPWESNGVTRGCAIGCTFDAYDHSRGPVELGVPVELMHIEDAIFEGLPVEDALLWPTRFLKAIPVGADLSLVCARFAVWSLTDAKWGATTLPDQEPEAIECCRRVAALWQRVIDGEPQADLRNEFAKEEAWAGARAGARARAWAGAGARAWAWAGAGAGAGAGARAWAWAGAGAGAGAGARAWAGAGAGARAWADFWRASADELERLLKAAPVKD